jgi:hypothetical protein
VVQELLVDHAAGLEVADEVAQLLYPACRLEAPQGRSGVEVALGGVGITGQPCLKALEVPDLVPPAVPVAKQGGANALGFGPVVEDRQEKVGYVVCLHVHAPRSGQATTKIREVADFFFGYSHSVLRPIMRRPVRAISIGRAWEISASIRKETAQISLVHDPSLLRPDRR